MSFVIVSTAEGCGKNIYREQPRKIENIALKRLNKQMVQVLINFMTLLNS